MNKKFERIIDSVLKERGTKILEERNIFKSLLNDYTKGEYKKERNVFIGTLEGNYIKKILASNKSVIEIQILIMAESLYNEYGYSKELCIWSISLLTRILGIIDEEKHIEIIDTKIKNAGNRFIKKKTKEEIKIIVEKKPGNNVIKSRIEMVLVEGGTFKMGGTEYVSEKPIHSVTLDSYYIGKYEVTQAEYEKVMGKIPSFFTGDEKPVEQLSWYDTVEYCNRLSELDGLPKYYNINGKNISILGGNGYRLPTEAEWEYAARGGNKSMGYKYSGSDNADTVSWYDTNSGGDTQPAGTKSSNELGIYDMSGNMWEWCWDWYNSDYYSQSVLNNPTGPLSGSYRVLRGGSCNSIVDCGRLAYRDGNNPESHCSGFRIAKSL